jgi:hypothetical protein
LGWLAGVAASRVNLQTDIPIRLNFDLDWRVLIYALASTLMMSVIVGIAPAVRASRRNLSSILHGSDGGATGDSRVRGALVVAQAGGSLMLLVVAGLFMRSLSRADHTDLGFDTNAVLNFTMDPLFTGSHRAQGTAFFKNLLDRVRVVRPSPKSHPGKRALRAQLLAMLGHGRNYVRRDRDTRQRVHRGGARR